MSHDESATENVNTGSTSLGPTGPTAEHSNTAGGHHFAGRASHDSLQYESSSATIPTDAVQEAQQLVDSFRAGRIRYRPAKSGIEVAIRRGAAVAGVPISDQLYAPYVEQLDAHLEAIGKAETGGQTSRLAGGGSKRKRYITPPPEGDEGSEDEETLRLPRRKKIDKSKLAFDVDIEFTDLRKPVKSYLSQLENFSRDPKEALRLLKSSGGAPVFSEDHWSKVLAGSLVDFDAINKHLFRGGTVKSEAEWNRAWCATATAMEYAFSDRRTELKTYRSYISNFFTQFKPKFHINVINLDNAIRTYVADARNILLDDTHQFVHLEGSYLFPGGLHYVEPK